MRKWGPLITITVLVIGFVVGVGLILRPELNPLSSRASNQLMPLPTLALDSPEAALTTSPTPMAVGSADLNNDGIVDDADVALWKTYLEEGNLRGDLNGDGKVSSIDFDILRRKITR